MTDHMALHTEMEVHDVFKNRARNAEIDHRHGDMGVEVSGDQNFPHSAAVTASIKGDAVAWLAVEYFE